jgi:hypothetical protein
VIPGHMYSALCKLCNFIIDIKHVFNLNILECFKDTEVYCVQLISCMICFPTCLCFSFFFYVLFLFLSWFFCFFVAFLFLSFFFVYLWLGLLFIEISKQCEDWWKSYSYNTTGKSWRCHLGNQEVVVLPIANGHEHHVIWKYCNHVMNQ